MSIHMFLKLCLYPWTMLNTMEILDTICHPLCVLVKRNCWTRHLDTSLDTQAICWTRRPIMVSVAIGPLGWVCVLIADVFARGSNEVSINVQSNIVFLVAGVAKANQFF